MAETFADDLPGSLDELEYLVLSLKGAADSAEQLNELLRRLHTLKGTAGTHGLQSVSVICHELEDRLEAIKGRPKLLGGQTDAIVEYFDLMRDASDAWKQTRSRDVSSALSRRLGQLEAQWGSEPSVPPPATDKRIRNCLIAVSSSTMAQMCAGSLSELDLRLEIESDGYVALGRCLDGEVDLLICTGQLRRLRGIAVLAALQASSGPSAHIRSVLVTSDLRAATRHRGAATVVLPQSQSFGELLTKTVTRMVNMADAAQKRSLSPESTEGETSA